MGERKYQKIIRRKWHCGLVFDVVEVKVRKDVVLVVDRMKLVFDSTVESPNVSSETVEAYSGIIHPDAAVKESLLSMQNKQA